MQKPRHLAIIMDGNGRWASQRRRPRSMGHIKGTRVAKQIITECSRLGIEWLTLYAFSTENWMRPEGEVRLLMRILKRYLERETRNLVSENIRVHVIGELDRLPADVAVALASTLEATSNCTGLNLVFALSYGSRAEITDTVRRLATKAATGELDPSMITEDTISSSLWTYPAPSPDLIIRTSGEQRLSNFLLWQAAYAEFWFTNTAWPDFSKNDLLEALSTYSERQRRFGRISQVSDEQLL